MGTIMCGRFWIWTERAVHNGSDPLLSALGVTGTASTPQVVTQLQSARSYGLGGKAADLPASRGASGRHSLLVWTKPGKKVRALALFFARLRPASGRRPPGHRPLLAEGQPQLRVAARASSCAWVRVAAALPNQSPSSRWRAASIGSLDLPASWLRCSVTAW